MPSKHGVKLQMNPRSVASLGGLDRQGSFAREPTIGREETSAGHIEKEHADGLVADSGNPRGGLPCPLWGHYRTWHRGSRTFDMALRQHDWTAGRGIPPSDRGVPLLAGVKIPRIPGCAVLADTTYPLIGTHRTI